MGVAGEQQKRYEALLHDAPECGRGTQQQHHFEERGQRVPETDRCKLRDVLKIRGIRQKTDQVRVQAPAVWINETRGEAAQSCQTVAPAPAGRGVPILTSPCRQSSD